MNEQNLSLILTYILAYRDMIDCEDAYQELRSNVNILRYTKACDMVETMRRQLYDIMDESEIVDILAEVRVTSQEIVKDIQNRIFD